MVDGDGPHEVEAGDRAGARQALARIEAQDLQLECSIVAGDHPAGSRGDLQGQLDQLERQLILDALQATGFNRTAAARVLGVTFRSLRYRIERLGIEVGDS